MKSKSVLVQKEKPYSEAQLKRLKQTFAELREASKSKSVKEFVKKSRQELKPISQVVEKPYSKNDIKELKKLFEELKKFRGHIYGSLCWRSCLDLGI